MISKHTNTVFTHTHILLNNYLGVLAIIVHQMAQQHSVLHLCQFSFITLRAELTLPNLKNIHTRPKQHIIIKHISQTPDLSYDSHAADVCCHSLVLSS